MRGRYDPIKRFVALRKTNCRYSQKRARVDGEGGERKMRFDLREQIRDWEWMARATLRRTELK